MLIPKIAGTTTPLQRFHPKNLVNFYNSASNCLITLILVSKSMFWGKRLEHKKIKYVVIQIPTFLLFIKTWLIVRCDFPKRGLQKVYKAFLSRICHAVDLAQLSDAEFKCDA